MKYLLDTVTVIKHFSGDKNIGKKAKRILSEINNDFYISVVSLFEILYLNEKKRININLSQTLNIIEKYENYKIVDLTTDIIRVAEKNKFYELHDRLIIATALYFDIPILSSDKSFKKIKKIQVIWD